MHSDIDLRAIGKMHSPPHRVGSFLAGRQASSSWLFPSKSADSAFRFVGAARPPRRVSKRGVEHGSRGMNQKIPGIPKG